MAASALILELAHGLVNNGPRQHNLSQCTIVGNNVSVRH